MSESNDSIKVHIWVNLVREVRRDRIVKHIAYQRLEAYCIALSLNVT